MSKFNNCMSKFDIGDILLDPYGYAARITKIMISSPGEYIVYETDTGCYIYEDDAILWEGDRDDG